MSVAIRRHMSTCTRNSGVSDKYLNRNPPHYDKGKMGGTSFAYKNEKFFLMVVSPMGEAVSDCAQGECRAFLKRIYLSLCVCL